ncbi:YkgJ family cysteine cluster protein [Thauera aromatica]|uniref:YkgJ family cysteine cluster protein n=1 Tax=Thauera aromatica TaxID=59405 RepID=UPI001FFCFD13|nr:YkgJ family cysteine cluster protein [Thauera aromatica]MCK2094386.1 YkgJ family cysteine cluster protein [Thauera aromatica]
MREDHCTRCGACCAAFRVDFHHSELASRAPGGVPDALVVPVTATLVRMRGTDAALPRCIALEGEVGGAVRCTLYAARPSPCRDFAPYAALGIGDEACARARRRHGLEAL